MKQYIDEDQLKQLSPKAKERLWRYVYRKQLEQSPLDKIPTEDLNKFYLSTAPYFSIGQMIEFLGDNGFNESWLMFSRPKELCDDLFEEVKKYLEK